MKFSKINIEGVTVIEPNEYKDERGCFVENYNQKKYEKFIGKISFVQDNESTSQKGTLRGLHFQNPPFAQAKLVRCAEGKVLDIALDIRKGSPTYGLHFAIVLSKENKKQIFIPKGFAHGFLVLSDKAVFAYKVDNHYSPNNDAGVRWDDKDLNIKWGIDKCEILISKKDQKLPFFSDIETPFKFLQ
jgi:dTDP-4-dehydrorhamnose 3,5-epimerase